jgi:hypothetical protein
MSGQQDFKSRLEQLVEFNQALVYEFQPESSPERILGSITVEDTIFFDYPQYYDILAAYLYAQNVILPTIEKEGLSEENLTLWLKEIHGLMTQFLLKEFAGKYSKAIVVRWHQGSVFQNILEEHFNHPKMSDDAFSNRLASEGEYPIVVPQAKAFIKLLRRINKEIPLSPDISAITKGNLWEQTFFQLITIAIVNPKILASEEKIAFDQTVRLGTAPNKIPSAMASFVKATVLAYKTFHRENIDINHVAHFLATTFYKLVDIHPFENGNGRTATCLINILLRSWGLPSILLRYIGEKENSESEYAQAIDQIDTTRKPLERLIRKRIVEAQAQPYSQQKKYDLTCIRLAIYEALKRIQKNHPKQNLNLICDLGRSESEGFSELVDNDEQVLCVMSKILKGVQEDEKRLDQEKSLEQALEKVIVSQEDKKDFAPFLQSIQKQAYSQALRRLCASTCDASKVCACAIALFDSPLAALVKVNEAAGEKGYAAAHHAARKGNKLLYDLLLSKGADPHAKDNAGKEAADLFPG